jgi:hypothetical protein
MGTQLTPPAEQAAAGGGLTTSREIRYCLLAFVHAMFLKFRI